MPVVDPDGKQLSGPVVPIDEVYIGTKFPVGEIQEYQVRRALDKCALDLCWTCVSLVLALC